MCQAGIDLPNICPLHVFTQLSDVADRGWFRSTGLTQAICRYSQDVLDGAIVVHLGDDLVGIWWYRRWPRLHDAEFRIEGGGGARGFEKVLFVEQDLPQ